MINKLSVLIPAYNEVKIGCLIMDKTIAIKLINNIEIESHQETRTKSFNQEINTGKGPAIRRAVELVTGDFLIVQDAYLEYEPEEFNYLLRPRIKVFSDVVYGPRFIVGNPHRILFFWHCIGNKFLTKLSNMFLNLNLNDMETCYELINSKIAKGLNLIEKRFGFEPEATSKLARFKSIRISEVGVSYSGRTYGEGKKIGRKEGCRAIYCTMKYNIFSRKQL